MKNASEIVKSINVSMAIEWEKQAWNEVSQDTLVNCFKKTRLYPQEVEEDDNPFEGEDELPALQELMDKVGSSCDAEVFIFTEDGIDVCLGNIDKTRMLCYLHKPKNRTEQMKKKKSHKDGTKGTGSGCTA